MKYSQILIAGVMVAGVTVAGPASAQPNPSAEPISGTITLDAGFTPDPRVVQVQAGGSEDASDTASNCRGYVSSSPDVRLVYDAGSFPLILSVAATGDTTLVVNAPDGRWYCDDDGGVNGQNPAVRFNTPTSGRYEIWVGTYRQGEGQPARLHISENSSQ